ncbi:HAMP domain-containing histidine kinase [Candidatus Desantisbacteria bacterium]|nr:HAMP domain-containing histidine kinase [Candidatus Desantisbacteria bacterium]
MRMRISITHKIIFLFILLISALSIIIGFFSFNYGKQALMMEFDDRAKTLVQGLAMNCEYPVLFGNKEMISSMGVSALSLRDVIFCEIQDEKGQVLFNKGIENKPYSCKYTAVIQTEKISDAEEGLVLGNQKKQFEKIGKIRLVFSLDNIKNRLRGIQQAIILIVILGIIGASIAITLLLRFVLGRPIDKLVADTRIVAMGNFDYKIAINTKDEIGSLAVAFNQMIDDLLITQNKLIKTEKMTAVVQIISEAAHDIRNPLAVISSGIYLLKKVLQEENPLVAQTIKQIEDAVARMSLLIEDLLHFSRPIQLNMDRTKINDMIKTAISELPEGLFSGVDRKLELADNIPLILADSNRLKQIVVNLVKNAVEAMEGVESKELRVESKKEGDFIKISVSDTGKGIPTEEIANIFDPFHTTKKKGLGLGLSICHRFAEAHGGRIGVESEVGKGTRFVVWLPDKMESDGM